MPQTLYVLLGNTNECDGTLSAYAHARAESAVELMTAEPDSVVLPTGSFGDHFNMSDTPHGELLADYLIQQGIDRSRILPHTPTCGTVQDAYGVLRRIKDWEEAPEVHVITSDFHMERVRHIFGRVLQGYTLVYHAAPSSREPDENTRSHEKKRLNALAGEWVEAARFDLGRTPEQAYASLGQELRHYDNLSYLPILGAFAAFGYFGSGVALEDGPWVAAVECFVGIVFVLILGYLYERFASTANAARRVMKAVEIVYGIPGISSTRPKRSIPGVDAPVRRCVGVLLALLVVLLVLRAAAAFA